VKTGYSRLGATGFLLFLTLLNVLNFTDRFLIQGFSVDMIADLHLSKFEFTLLTGFVFTGFYTVMGLVMGALADRLHRPRLMAAGLLLWSALTAATGAVSNFTQAAAVRLVTGVGEATLTPAALGVLGDVFSSRRRAMAAGFYYLGSPLGIACAFLLAGAFGTQLSWRHCFFLVGGLGVVLSLGLLLMREPRGRRVAVKSEPGFNGSMLRDVVAVLAGSPALCFVIAGSVCVIFSQGTFVLDQLWLVQERGFAKAQAQSLSGVMFLFGGMLGTVLGGVASDAMEARMAGGRLVFLAWAYAIGVPFGFAYRLTDPGSMLFMCGMFCGSAMITIGYGAMFASVQDLTPPHLRSTMTAFLILCMTLLGTSPGNLAVGWLSDMFGRAGRREPITDAVLLGSSVWLLAIPCFLFAARAIKATRLDQGHRHAGIADS
jgi:MFS family permease